ncbi:putative disease resistance RPP13-like protein 1 [Cannabis sativa]|uniref:putative disease resistance RPP13-like protein 1 n=1 Tax=Cannabis sativa TaxID=3483 RepID=UPI0029CA2C59|nr:putative disease resistance RPP13-like protein 1 [Cannabis sativa]
MAEAFLTVLYEKLFERMDSPAFANFFLEKRSICEQLRELNLKLKTTSLLVNDAEERQLEEPDVKEWLDDLKHVIYRAQDMVDHVDYQLLSNSLGHESYSTDTTTVLMKMKFFLSSMTEFDRTIQAEIAKILVDTNLLLQKRVLLGLKEDNQNTIPSQRSVVPLREQQRVHVHGRDDDKDKIMEWLITNGTLGSEKIGVLPIVGMGGIGKTALARLVYNDTKLKEHGFELKLWATVSAEFDVVRAMRIILQAATNSYLTADINVSIKELQDRIKDALRGKKFLLVLDNVWDENEHNWNVLKLVFTSGARDSKIIVTTHSQQVAKIVGSGKTYELSQVSPGYCWKIFIDHAFNGDLESNKHLQEVGKKIVVEKCKGLPLAVISLGGLLRFENNSNIWEKILRNHVWEWYECPNNNIVPSLWLSYLYLPSYLKQCFAYCSMFPKNHEFEKERMVLLWMAEGFLEDNQLEKRLEEAGEEYFDNLVSRSLFQRSSRDDSKFIMHDLVHDLAMFVSGEFCMAVEDNNSSELLSNKIRHLSHTTTSVTNCDSVRNGLSRALNLRTWAELSTITSHNEITIEFFLATKFLRVLSLLSFSMPAMLPDSISKLKHLRYLDLSQNLIIELPSSICMLYNLQTLLLSCCISLRRLPKDLGRLINLRHLDTIGSPLEEMPPHMGNLKKLQVLHEFVLGKGHDNASTIRELGELHQLSGELYILGLQNVANVNDALEANLRYKEKLTGLTLYWLGETMDTRREREVLEALQPHTNLKKLIIYSYAGFSFPNWIGDSSFSNIVSIHLSHNKYCWSLPSLGQLPSLQKLEIQSFHGVETIGAEFYYGNNPSNNITPFQSIVTLIFHDMLAWKEWSTVGGDDRDGGVLRPFPSLKTLSLNGCPNLSGSLPDLYTLESLHISGIYGSYFPEPRSYSSLHKLLCKKLEFPGSHCYVSVTELRIQYCDSVKSFPLDYFPSLKKLIFFDCSSLESVTFSEENGISDLRSLIVLELYNCRNVTALPQHMQKLLPSLTTLKIYHCQDIKLFPQEGLPSNLKELHLCNCSQLVAQHKQWGLQGLSSLNKLSIGGYDDDDEEVLESFLEGLLPISLTELSLSYIPNLQKLNDNAFQHVASLHKLSLQSCKNLQVLSEQVFMGTSLRSLFISGCPILENRYQPRRGEDWHKISHIPHISIGHWSRIEE